MTGMWGRRRRRRSSWIPDCDCDCCDFGLLSGLLLLLSHSPSPSERAVTGAIKAYRRILTAAADPLPLHPHL
jgi:hypothetical protein